MKLQISDILKGGINTMLSKETKLKVLENFYALDYVFFGKPAIQMESCCDAIMEDYMSVKGALMSVMIELYKLVNHKPEAIEEKVDRSTLMKKAATSAKFAREMCHKLVATEKGKADIKSELREALKEDKTIKIHDLVETKIKEKAFRLATDNLLIASTISESEKYSEMNEWSGRIVEDSYKILRDNLVESALLVLQAAN